LKQTPVPRHSAPKTPYARDLHRWLQGVATIAAAVNKPASLQDLLDLISKTACELMDYEFCAVLLPDVERSVLVIEGSHGLSSDYIAGVNSTHPVVIHEGEDAAPSSRAFLTRQSLQVCDISSHRAFEPWGGVAREQGFNSMISVPLVVSDSVLGTLNCYTRARHEFGEEERELLSTLADQAGTAIATSRWRADEARKLEDLRALNASLEEQHHLLRQGEAIHQRLTRVALQAGGPTAVAKALSELLGCPVVIEDQAGGCLASVAHAGVELDTPGVTAREQGKLKVLLDTVLPRGEVAEVPPWDDAIRPESRVLVPVSLNGEVVARIWLPGPAGDLKPLAHRAIEQAATVLTLEILRTRAALEVEWRIAGELVTDLVTAHPAVLGTLKPRAARLGHDLAAPHHVLVVKGDAGEDAPDSRIVHAVRSVAERIRPRPLVTAVGDCILTLWALQDRADGEISAIADQIRRTVRRSHPRITASVAVSPLCEAVADYPRAYRIARGAVGISQISGVQDATVALHDLGVYGLLLQLEDPRELARFAGDVLGPLHKHDAARNTSIAETLRAYVQNNLNTARTAEVLYVHPNTVALRIRRAEGLLNRSLANAADLVHVTTALMVEEVAGFTRGR
jgi:sugar diacid utilization regulator